MSDIAKFIANALAITGGLMYAPLMGSHQSWG